MQFVFLHKHMPFDCTHVYAYGWIVHAWDMNGKCGYDLLKHAWHKIHAPGVIYCGQPIDFFSVSGDRL
jgi:hypothetical protein